MGCYKSTGGRTYIPKKLEECILDGREFGVTVEKRDYFPEGEGGFVNRQEDEIYKLSSFWHGYEVKSYSITDDEGMALVLKYREENRPQIVTALSAQLQKMAELKTLKSSNGNFFKKSDLTKKEQAMVNKANGIIQMAKGTYSIKPDEVDGQEYSTYPLISTS